MKVELTEAVWLDERGVLSLVELAECSGFSAGELRELVELGGLEPLDAGNPEWSFAPHCIAAARAARRLRNDFELDAPGLALVLSLLERVADLERELERLRARFPSASIRRF